MKRVAMVYSGRVQGVGFRATARAVARGLPVTGWVRNEPEGTVRLEAQGTDEAITALREGILEHLGRGIDGERVNEMAVDPNEEVFEIRYR